jgi:hypothetical protein
MDTDALDVSLGQFPRQLRDIGKRGYPFFERIVGSVVAGQFLEIAQNSCKHLLNVRTYKRAPGEPKAERQDALRLSTQKIARRAVRIGVYGKKLGTIVRQNTARPGDSRIADGSHTTEIFILIQPTHY